MHSTVWITDNNGNGVEITCDGANNVALLPVYNEAIRARLAKGEQPPGISIHRDEIRNALDVLEFSAGRHDAASKI